MSLLFKLDWVTFLCFGLMPRRNRTLALQRSVEQCNYIYIYIYVIVCLFVSFSFSMFHLAVVYACNGNISNNLMQ